MTKICTDLQQSKRLIKLGIDINTANMYWKRSNFNGDSSWKYHIKRAAFPMEFFKSKDYVPAWSADALSNLLPPYLFEFERGIDLNIYPNLNGKGWHCSYMPNCIENMKKDKFKQITNGATIIDAMFEMIIRLHELNLL